MADEADPRQTLGLSASGLTRFLRTAQRAVGLTGEVDVLLADDAALKRLNKTFRGKNKATDVLSFPACDENGSGVAGDLAISLETAARQAAQYGHSLRDEVRVLLLHGVLHLAGFDHEADEGEMAAREVELRRELRVATSLIARVTQGAATAKADSSAALRNDKQKNKQRQTQNAGILRSAQNDKRNKSAQDDIRVTDDKRGGCGKRVVSKKGRA